MRPPSPSPAAVDRAVLDRYLAECRDTVLHEIRQLMPPDTRHTGDLYRLMMDYPMRPAKALRPSLCIAACRAFGGTLDACLPTAAALELYHNAFLLHDDVEDGSELRRGGPTLHRSHGVAVAINVGDGMLALALRPLVANAHHVGLATTLRVLDEVTRMALESAEGQAVELAWIRDGTWTIRDRDYLRMVYKKSTLYSFVTPLTVGALCARVDPARLQLLQRFAALVGIAFQIQDDVLNLVGDESTYGKEIAGDLWEGKRTLVLLHCLRNATPADRDAALACLATDRAERTAADVRRLRYLLDATGSIAFAHDVAQRHCARGTKVLETLAEQMPPSEHLTFLRALASYVLHRDR